MRRKKVICIGEALIDRIRNKSNQGFSDFLGGAPANVACALRKLKIDSTFIGSLGSDDYGKKFIKQFNELDINLNKSCSNFVLAAFLNEMFVDIMLLNIASCLNEKIL